MDKNLFSLGKLHPRTLKDIKIILRELSYRTDCLSLSEEIRDNIGAVVCAEDDIRTAVVASLMYHYLRKKGESPRVYCIGGNSWFTKYFLGNRRDTDGKRLAGVCLALAVPQADVVVLDRGKDTRAISKELIEYIHQLPWEERNKDILFCLTKKSSLLFERSFKKAREEEENRTFFRQYFYIIEGKKIDEEVIDWQSGRAAGNGRMLCHEVAGILPRCIAYGGDSQLPLFETPSEKCVEAAQRLEKAFGLRSLSWWRWIRSSWQFPMLWVDLHLHLKEMKYAQQTLINEGRKIVDDGEEEKWLMSHYYK